MLDVHEIITLGPVVPVLVIDDASSAAALAGALVDGGARVLEVTLRTPAAPAAIEAMAAVPGAIVGAGTVLNARDAERAVAAGARFLISPGLTAEVVEAARSLDVALLPGVATASDIMRGLDLGLRSFKFFPAEASGGAPAVRAFVGPFPDVRFCPTGGISAATAPDYLALPNVTCVGGSWLAPVDAVRLHDWPRVTALAAQAAALGDRS